MSRTEIILVSCHESTTVAVDLSEQEVALLKRVAAVIRAASDRGCEPWMAVGQDELREAMQP